MIRRLNKVGHESGSYSYNGLYPNESNELLLLSYLFLEFPCQDYTEQAYHLNPILVKKVTTQCETQNPKLLNPKP